MNPGFHIVVLGFCGADQLGDVSWDLFATLRNPEGALLDTQTMPLMRGVDYARAPQAKVGIASYADPDASCGAPSEIEVAISSKEGKVTLDTRAGSPTPYCD